MTVNFDFRVSSQLWKRSFCGFVSLWLTWTINPTKLDEFALFSPPHSRSRCFAQNFDFLILFYECVCSYYSFKFRWLLFSGGETKNILNMWTETGFVCVCVRACVCVYLCSLSLWISWLMLLILVWSFFRLCSGGRWLQSAGLEPCNIRTSLYYIIQWL